MFKKRNLDLYDMTFSEPLTTVHIEDIIIPEDFKRTRCNRNKIRWAKEYYQRHLCFDKPISVIAEINERNQPNKLVLIDEYSRYLAALQLGLTELEIKYIDINTYCNEKNI